jgi:predicted ATPase
MAIRRVRVGKEARAEGPRGSARDDRTPSPQLASHLHRSLGNRRSFGRQFTAAEIAVASEVTLHDVLSGLEPAVESGLVDASAEVAGNYQFTHALIRETIYEDIRTSRRLRIHARAADALVTVYCAHLEPALTRIAADRQAR